MRRALTAATVTLLVLTGLSPAHAQLPTGLSPTVSASSSAGQRPPTANALRLLRHLDVRRERNRGYDRAKFADWYDANGDGCDTRDEVLIAESVTNVRVGSGCTIRGGKWFSKYDGKTTRNSSTFDIDHLVPLAEAWGSGARTLEQDQAGQVRQRPRLPVLPDRRHRVVEPVQGRQRPRRMVAPTTQLPVHLRQDLHRDQMAVGPSRQPRRTEHPAALDTGLR